MNKVLHLAQPNLGLAHRFVGEAGQEKVKSDANLAYINEGQVRFSENDAL